MKITVQYPVFTPGYDPALLAPEGMAAVARAAEDAGFHAVAFTEHPAAPREWLRNGGHETLDPLAALAYCAAVTSRIKLMTYLLVLPLRDPFFTAKSIATVDLLSAGRLVVGTGTGYVRGEFEALGVPMDERNSRFDESLEVILGLLGGDPFSHAGQHFRCVDIESVPAPKTPGGPPILVGGNTVKARERAARHQGWCPLVVGDVVDFLRTSPIHLFELGSHIDRLRERASELQGSDAVVEVHAATPETYYLGSGGSVERHRDHYGVLEESGCDGLILVVPGGCVDQVIDNLHAYGQSFGLDANAAQEGAMR